MQSLKKLFGDKSNVHSFPFSPDVVDQARHVWCPNFASVVLNWSYEATTANKHCKSLITKKLLCKYILKPSLNLLTPHPALHKGHTDLSMCFSVQYDYESEL